MSIKSYREESRVDWGSASDRPLTLEQINTGAILRIADATEKMAQRHTDLMAERDRYKRLYEQEANHNAFLQRQGSAYRGQITKLRNKLRSMVVTGAEPAEAA